MAEALQQLSKRGKRSVTAANHDSTGDIIMPVSDRGPRTFILLPTLLSRPLSSFCVSRLHLLLACFFQSTNCLTITASISPTAQDDHLHP